MSGPRVTLSLEGAALERGESIRMVCPFCGGGSSNEKSLVLSHNDDGALLFVCHRSNCGVGGRLSGTGMGGGGDRKPARWAAELADKTKWVLLHRHAQDLAAKWRLTRPLYYNPETGRVMLHVLGPRAQIRGYVGRAWPDRSPKTLNVVERTDQPFIHWPRVFDSPAIFVVEDIGSAERLAEKGMTAVALLGTHATYDALEEILAVSEMKRHIIIALDKDAIKRSIQLRDDLFLRTNGKVIVGLLEVGDIKDMTHEELDTWLNAVSLRL